MIDESPDTSWLGEYANRPTSEFSIDRAHSLDCASQSYNPQTEQAKKILEHVQQTIGDLYNAVLAQYNGTLANAKLDAERDALDDAYNEVGELIDSVQECDCYFAGSRDSRSYQYFNPCYENYAGIPEAEIRKYCEQDYERMESLERGEWAVPIAEYASSLLLKA